MATTRRRQHHCVSHCRYPFVPHERPILAICRYYLTYIAQMAGLQGNVAMVTSGVQYAVFIIFTGVM